MKTDNKVLAKARRHNRIRKNIKGTPERPRLSVSRSLRHICAQIIDDSSGVTLAAASSLAVEGDKKGSKVAMAKTVGGKIALLAKASQIEKVVFDRGGSLYHGRVKALAEAAREGGLLF